MSCIGFCARVIGSEMKTKKGACFSPWESVVNLLPIMLMLFLIIS